MTDPRSGKDTTGRPGNSQATTGELVARISEDVSRLVRDELKVASLEVSSKAKKAGVGVAGLGAGGLLALYGVGALVAAAILGLAEAVAPWLAALIVAAVLLLVAAGLAVFGKRGVQKAVPPLPEEAMAGLKEDVDTLRGRHDGTDQGHSSHPDPSTPRSTP